MTMPFDPALLEAIVPVLLRDERTLVIPGVIVTLMVRNLSVENKMNLITDLQHICVTDHEGFSISAERSGDRLPKLHKAQSRLSVG